MKRIILLLVLAVSATAQKPATERLEGLETVHGMLDDGRGARVQTILTRPRGASDRLPAVMLVQWLSCDPIELLSPRLDGMSELVKRIAMQSNAVMLRVEKRGLGASDGPPCKELDFQTELAAYRAGLAQLRAHPWVDPQRIVLVGMSYGGGVLPLVSGDQPVAGYLVVNSWSRTWFEHMMEMMRRNPELRGTAPGEVSSRMGGYADLYADYLIEKKLPGAIVKQKPHLAALWDDEPAHQYGRPAAFYQQLQDLNLAEAWSKVSAPTLVLWGEYDWIMGREDHERIVSLVNRNRPGAGRLVVMPRTNHGIYQYESFDKSVNDPRSGAFHEGAANAALEWLREVWTRRRSGM